jgi:hypothetical protein
MGHTSAGSRGTVMTRPNSLPVSERSPSDTLPRRPHRAPTSPDAGRRWFMRKGGDEQGPYTTEMLLRSFHYGSIKRTTLIRAENETEWRPLSTSLDLIAPSDTDTSGEESVRPVLRTDQEVIEYREPGSFGLGLAAGFFGGIIGFALIRWMARGEKTKAGAALGFFFSAILGLLRLLMQ